MAQMRVPDGLDAREHAWLGLVWASTTVVGAVDEALIRRHDLPLSWFEVLFRLANHPEADEPLTVSRLASDVLLSRSQVSRALDTLDRRGLIRRDCHARDARATTIGLTEQGRRAYAEAALTYRARIADVFGDHLSDDDVEALMAIWHKVGVCSRSP